MIKWKILKRFVYICLCTVYDFVVFGAIPADFVSKIKLYLHKADICLCGYDPSMCEKKEHII